MTSEIVEVGPHVVGRSCVTGVHGQQCRTRVRMRTIKLRRTYLWALFILGLYLYVHLLYIKNKGMWFDYENVSSDISSIQSYRPEDIEDDDTILVNTSLADDLSKKVKVFCFIATTTSNLLTKAKAVNDTWGKRCDKILFVTSSPSKLSMTISFNIEDSRSHLTGKTMSMIHYIYRYHLDEYQWFMKADDDTFVVMENLKLLLSKCDHQKPIYLGHHFKVHLKQGYMSGGAGYVMSQSALRMIVEDGLQKDLCPRDGNDEDVDVGRCLETVGVQPYKTTDKFGRETFHAFSILNYIIGPVPVYLLQYPHKPARAGKNCCSQLPITFHYTSPRMMYITEYFLYRTAVYGRQLATIDSDFFKEEVSRLDKDPGSVFVPYGPHGISLVDSKPKKQNGG
ncbi:glycoprotein-N-acetylgalactosamine 3-beta-galactosyltransferase 1-like [Ylistrum balloti]|uniref:glycoprotein-N-acetylgalactosamine 3-beta-galactosyltransferase 1-like n=1 Tax=Ylistrum balloti TaxID=509963 RepID=UPI002905E788|nr:glycoprotein-N-acetylgalactosamine 3-beta-galactosyltransferase 1-like [Ylistrum balloti]